MKSLKAEALEGLILFGESMLRRTIASYLVHYHQHRNHHGLDNRIIKPGNEVGRIDGEVTCQETLGGLLRYYYRDAA